MLNNLGTLRKRKAMAPEKRGRGIESVRVSQQVHRGRQTSVRGLFRVRRLFRVATQCS